MKLQQHPFALALVLGVAAPAIPVLAQDVPATPVAFQESDGSLQRIAISRKLRMLSQGIPAAACHLAAQIEPDTAQEQLASYVAEFEKILNALELGDSDYDISDAEPRTKTRAKIQDLRTILTPVKAAAEGILADPAKGESLQVILDQNLTVLDASNDLVAELTGQYSNPVEMVQADAFLIDILGRQRMLTQKMSKEACILSNTPNSPETAKALESSMGVFEASLQALRSGMPSAGIKKPPTAEISNALEDVAVAWSAVKPLLAQNLDNPQGDAQRMADTFQGLNATVPHLEKVLELYTEALTRPL